MCLNDFHKVHLFVRICFRYNHDSQMFNLLKRHLLKNMVILSQMWLCHNIFVCKSVIECTVKSLYDMTFSTENNLVIWLSTMECTDG